MAYIAMAYIVMAYIVMADIVMTYIVMACVRTCTRTYVRGNVPLKVERVSSSTGKRFKTV